MLGAIIGDMVGSVYEANPIKRKEFLIFNPKMQMSDDSLLTIAVAKTLIKHYPIDFSESALKVLQEDLAKEFVETWDQNKGAGFGWMFYEWCATCKKTGTIASPYNSYGNGSAMRISPVGWVARDINEVKILSKVVTEITHNHPEGLKGAEAVAVAIHLALRGATKFEIAVTMINEYYLEIADFNFEELVKTYSFSEICQKSVPQAIYCFLISNSVEDAIRNCIAIGGDCDTTAAIAGSIAEAFYQKDRVSKFEDKFLYLLIDPEVEALIKKFHSTIGSKKFSEEKAESNNEFQGNFQVFDHENVDETLNKKPLICFYTEHGGMGTKGLILVVFEDGTSYGYSTYYKNRDESLIKKIIENIPELKGLLQYKISDYNPKRPSFLGLDTENVGVGNYALIDNSIYPFYRKYRKLHQYRISALITLIEHISKVEFKKMYEEVVMNFEQIHLDS